MTINQNDSTDSLINLIDLMLINNRFQSSFVMGHLLIEEIAKKTITIVPNIYSNRINRMTHMELIKALYDLKYLKSCELRLLISINLMRNKLVHDLAYSPKRQELKGLFLQAKSVFFEYADGFSAGLHFLQSISLIATNCQFLLNSSRR